MLPNFSKKHFHAIQVFDFEFEARANAAHVSHEAFHAIRISHFETGENAAHFPKKHLMRFDFLIVKQGKMLPIFPKKLSGYSIL